MRITDEMIERAQLAADALNVMVSARVMRAALSAALSIEQTQPVAWIVREITPSNGRGPNTIITGSVVPRGYEAITPLYAHPPVSALVNAQAEADVVEIPAEPTDEMIEAGEEEIASRRSHGCRVYASDIWATMVASLRPAKVGSTTRIADSAEAGGSATSTTGTGGGDA